MLKHQWTRCLPRLGSHVALVLCLPLGLAACQQVEVHTFQIQTAAHGTQVEAKQVVGLVYAQGAEAEIDKLLYSGGDLTQAIKRIYQRYPQLKPLFDQGVIGNTAGGFVALRDASQEQRWEDLIWQENADRVFLYRQTTVAVGHGLRNMNGWLPYASFSFGQEWIDQGQPGWWYQDEAGTWHQH